MIASVSWTMLVDLDVLGSLHYQQVLPQSSLIHKSDMVFGVCCWIHSCRFDQVHQFASVVNMILQCITSHVQAHQDFEPSVTMQCVMQSRMVWSDLKSQCNVKFNLFMEWLLTC